MTWVLVGVWLGTLNNGAAAGIPLKPTPTASPGTGGAADIGPGWISLQLDGMTPGIYQIQAVLKTNHTTVTLAWVGVVDPDSQPALEAGGSIRTRDSAHQAVALQTKVQISLPSDIRAADIESIAVADRAGIRWLVGRRVNPAGRVGE